MPPRTSPRSPALPTAGWQPGATCVRPPAPSVTRLRCFSHQVCAHWFCAAIGRECTAESPHLEVPVPSREWSPPDGASGPRSSESCGHFLGVTQSIRGRVGLQPASSWRRVPPGSRRSPSGGKPAAVCLYKRHSPAVTATGCRSQVAPRSQSGRVSAPNRHASERDPCTGHY